MFVILGSTAFPWKVDNEFQMKYKTSSTLPIKLLLNCKSLNTNTTEFTSLKKKP